jgi:hypothetical protein
MQKHPYFSQRFSQNNEGLKNENLTIQISYVQ